MEMRPDHYRMVQTEESDEKVAQLLREEFNNSAQTFFDLAKSLPNDSRRKIMFFRVGNHLAFLAATVGRA